MTNGDPGGEKGGAGDQGGKIKVGDKEYTAADVQNLVSQVSTTAEKAQQAQKVKPRKNPRHQVAGLLPRGQNGKGRRGDDEDKENRPAQPQAERQHLQKTRRGQHRKTAFSAKARRQAIAKSVRDTVQFPLEFFRTRQATSGGH